MTLENLGFEKTLNGPRNMMGQLGTYLVRKIPGQIIVQEKGGQSWIRKTPWPIGWILRKMILPELEKLGFKKYTPPEYTEEPSIF